MSSLRIRVKHFLISSSKILLDVATQPFVAQPLQIDTLNCPWILQRAKPSGSVNIQVLSWWDVTVSGPATFR